MTIDAIELSGSLDMEYSPPPHFRLPLPSSSSPPPPSHLSEPPTTPLVSTPSASRLRKRVEKRRLFRLLCHPAASSAYRPSKPIETFVKAHGEGVKESKESMAAESEQGMQEVEFGNDEGEAESRRGRRAEGVEYGIVSICGRSREMEDRAIAVPWFMMKMRAEEADHGDGAKEEEEKLHFFGVYDGHGGGQAAEWCKRRLHVALAEEMRRRQRAARDEEEEEEGAWREGLRRSFRKMDEEVMKEVAGGWIGTTAVVVVLGIRHIWAANCGDSRALLCRRKSPGSGSHSRFHPLSIDHRPSDPAELARILALGGRVVARAGGPHRVMGILAISRSLGDRFLKPFVSGDPSFTCTLRHPDDQCLILASDGLWDVLPNDLVCKVATKALVNFRALKKRHHTRLPERSRLQSSNPYGFANFPTTSKNSNDPHCPAEMVAALLAKLAIAKQSNGNITVLVVDLQDA